MSLQAQPCHVAATPAEAWQLARRITTPDDLICVTGSFFIAAEMRDLIFRDVERGGFDVTKATDSTMCRLDR